MKAADLFENGVIYINGKEINTVSDLQWINHPKFAGVLMKNLFCGKESNDNMSAMIVKIDPHHEIGTHVHEGKSELHEVISGEGIAEVGDVQINYRPGVISLIPSDLPHSVRAGDSGIVLLAKFTPPLN
ncbi:MAG: cupin domain-containing protein [Spirochaetes bacterium]|nr:cupin domain-containing protein [Spirochaetota bacterium]